MQSIWGEERALLTKVRDMDTTLGDEACAHLWDCVSKGQSLYSQRSEPPLLLTVPRTAQSPHGDLQPAELLVSLLAEVCTL